MNEQNSNNPNNNSLNDEKNTVNSEQDSTLKIKKKIIITLCCACVFVLMYFTALTISDFITKNKAASNETESNRIYFYEADYNEDITKDNAYMQLNRDIYYTVLDTGISQTVFREDYASYGSGFNIMAKLVDSIILGNANEYNELFSDRYYKNHNRHVAFTPQKLYGNGEMGGIRITEMEVSDVTDKELGIVYTRYIFKLEYMIYKNNGTFRSDVESNAVKPQYYIITDIDGICLIDDVIDDVP